MESSIKFAELCAKTNYAFLEGASHPEEIIEQAYTLEYQAIGIVDPNGFYAIPRAHVSAKNKLPLLIGTQVTQNAFLFSTSRLGYGNLCQYLSEHTLLENPPQYPTEPPLIEDTLLLLQAKELSQKALLEAKEKWGDRLYLVISRFEDGCQTMPIIAAYAKQLGISCVASNQPLFHLPERKPLQDVLTSIREKKPLSDTGFALLPNGERYLKPKKFLARLFGDHPEWLANTIEVAQRCHFSLDEIQYHYPQEWIPKPHTAESYLAYLVWEGAKKRYPDGISEKVEKQLKHELTLINDLKYADYFLTTWDIVRFARSEKILCQGRGSAANSIVCYVLGITSIDPIRLELLFERFISRERNEPPDIDIDFEHERREEVIQYIYSRYGRHRAAISAEVICYRRRSALREVAKSLNISETSVEKILFLSKKRDFNKIDLDSFQAAAPEIPTSKLQLYLDLVKQIQGFPRHLGTHVGGFVLTHESLNRSIPIQSAAMPNRSIVQWDKNDLDSLGFVRVDVLGLGILTAIRKSFEYLKETYSVEMELHTVPQEDPKVYEMLQQADTVGIFQIESRAQMSMLPRLKPRNFFDLVTEIALVRPGPIQGEMVHPYLRRRAAKEKITYPHPLLKEILAKTWGVPLFQEQIMQMAMTVADFTAGQADELRRSMGSWRRWPNRLARLSETFRKGLLAKGIPEDFANKVFSQIQGFAEYGFPESHAASFAILAYTTAYLKCYYPDVFLCALLNSQPMGFYSTHSLIFDGKRHGVNVLPISINHSTWDNHLQTPQQLRLGYREIKGLSNKVGLALERVHDATHLLHFVDRLQEELSPHPLTKRDLFLLAGANAFESIGLSRRRAFWEIQSLDLKDSAHLSFDKGVISLPKESPWEKLSLDYSAQGVTINQHPISLFRDDLNKKGILDSRAVKCKNKTRSEVAGLVVSRQMPSTASGVLFITLEDEYGFINLIIWNATYQKFRITLLKHSFLHCIGNIEKAEDGDVYHVIVEEAYPLLDDSFELIESHDFH